MYPERRKNKSCSRDQGFFHSLEGHTTLAVFFSKAWLFGRAPTPADLWGWHSIICIIYNQDFSCWCLWLTWDMLSPDCFLLPAVCGLHNSCIWRLWNRRNPADSVVRSVPWAAISKLTSSSVACPFSYGRHSSLQGPSTSKMTSRETNHCLLLMYFSTVPHLETEPAFLHPKTC